VVVVVVVGLFVLDVPPVAGAPLLSAAALSVSLPSPPTTIVQPTEKVAASSARRARVHRSGPLSRRSTTIAQGTTSILGPRCCVGVDLERSGKCAQMNARQTRGRSSVTASSVRCWDASWSKRKRRSSPSLPRSLRPRRSRRRSLSRTRGCVPSSSGPARPDPFAGQRGEPVTVTGRRGGCRRARRGRSKKRRWGRARSRSCHGRRSANGRWCRRGRGR